MKMPDFSDADVTPAYADLDILSCWVGKMKHGLEYKQGRAGHYNVSLWDTTLSSSTGQADKFKKKKKKTKVAKLRG